MCPLELETRVKRRFAEVSIVTMTLALASEVRAQINVVFKTTAVTTASEINTVNI